MLKPTATEERGMGAGGKGPPARSIRSFLQLIEVAKTGDSGAKILFRHAETPENANFPEFDHL